MATFSRCQFFLFHTSTHATPTTLMFCFYSVLFYKENVVMYCCFILVALKKQTIHYSSIIIKKSYYTSTTTIATDMSHSGNSGGGGGGGEIERYDEMFSEMAGRLGGLPPMMDAFFGFLARRTDFYVVADPASPAPMGFPAGFAKKALLQSFDKYTFRDYKDTEHFNKSSSGSGSNSSNSSSSNTSSSDAGKKSTAVTPSKASSSSSSRNSNASSSSSIMSPPPPPVDVSGPQRPIGNGGLGPGYYWTQTLKEVTIYIDLEPGMPIHTYIHTYIHTSVFIYLFIHSFINYHVIGIKKADIQCNIEASRVAVAIRGTEALVGMFEDPVRRSESMWTLSSGDAGGGGGDAGPQLVLSLEKTRKTWWKSAVVGDPEIDTTKVDSSQAIDEYDDATQATIRKLMFEQKEKVGEVYAHHMSLTPLPATLVPSPLLLHMLFLFNFLVLNICIETI
jgi:hypothetical protein